MSETTSETHEEFRGLMARVLARSDSAAEELLKQYEPELLRAIRRRLNPKMRSKFDSLDFAQDVWKSFFVAVTPDRFQTPKDLAAFLATVAKYKVIDAVRQRLKFKKHNVQRERSINDSQWSLQDALTAAQATPSEVVSTEEQWQAFLRTEPLVYRRVFVLLREARTPQSIADELGIGVRTVRRLAARLKAELTL
jgi:RNA polymerase sigma factor (sigma-70 family)